MKYYLFIDESGDHGLANINPAFPVFLLCGVLISSDSYEQLKTNFNDGLKRNDIELEIWIEKRGKKEDQQLRQHFQKLIARGTGYVSTDQLKNYGMKITFKNKQENINGLQLADLIAYPVARYVLDSSRANPAFDLIKPKIYTKAGKIYGLKIFP